MIKSIEFENFRNLNKKYILNERMNIVFGKNSSGKSNLLDGINLSFSSITGEYFKISNSDFINSDDSKVITIKVHLKEDSITSLISLTLSLLSNLTNTISPLSKSATDTPGLTS